VFLILGGGAYAATGGNFILGQSNGAATPTRLTSPTTDAAGTLVVGAAGDPGPAAGGVDAVDAGGGRAIHATTNPGAVVDTEAVADDFEWNPNPGFEGRSVWRGREGFVEFVRTWTEEFEDSSIRLEHLIDAGDDRVVVLTHQSAQSSPLGRAQRIACQR
jgi:SnoaL-like domain